MNTLKKISASIARSQAITTTSVKRRKGMMPASETFVEIQIQSPINSLTLHGKETRTYQTSIT
jgi:hypothetical protein